MADYTTVNWLNRTGSNTGKPRISAANLNRMEAGILDASTHHKRGTFAAMPAASAANKNWIYWAYDTGERYMSDGVTWNPLPVGNGALQTGAVSNTKLGAGAVTWDKIATSLGNNPMLAAWLAVTTYGAQLRFKEVAVAAGGSNIMQTTDYPATGLLLVHALRANDSANTAFSILAVHCDYYTNRLTSIHNGPFQNGNASTFAVSSTTASAARSVLMTPPASIGACNVGVLFLSFSGVNNHITP